MKSLSPETKVCNACRTAYYSWKSINTEFGDILSRIDNEALENVGIDDDTSSVKKKMILGLIEILKIRCLFTRMIRWN